MTTCYRHPANEAFGDEHLGRELPWGKEHCTGCRAVVKSERLRDYGQHRLCAECIERRGLLTCADCGDLTHREDALVIGAAAFCGACAVDHECAECLDVRLEPFKRAGVWNVPLCTKCCEAERITVVAIAAAA